MYFPNMTNEHDICQTPRRVAMIAYEDAHILDVVGPLEVLSGTKLFLPEGAAPYEISIIADRAGPVRTSGGFSLNADHGFKDAMAFADDVDTLMIAGGHGTLDAMKNEALMAFAAAAAKGARRIISICTGAMVLAELGLLDGRRATTHWWWCPVMAQKYPKVQVDADAIYVRDDRIWTSAGVTTGMDLALALVDADWGHDVALQVARYNVMYMVRPGGQSQFSAHLVASKAEDASIAKVLDYILNNLREPLSVTQLAAWACMSERSFARKFADETDMTPAQYVEAARFQAARVALEQTSAPVEQIARTVGFMNPERMRRVFIKHLGISASDYRARFSLGLVDGNNN